MGSQRVGHDWGLSFSRPCALSSNIKKLNYDFILPSTWWWNSYDFRGEPCLQPEISSNFKGPVFFMLKANSPGPNSQLHGCQAASLVIPSLPGQSSPACHLDGWPSPTVLFPLGLPQNPLCSSSWSDSFAALFKPRRPPFLDPNSLIMVFPSLKEFPLKETFCQAAFCVASILK